MKQIFKNALPREIVKQKKQPYHCDEISLLGGAVEDRFLNESINKKHHFFDWEIVQRLRSKLAASEKDFNFNDNLAFVIIAATMIILKQFDNSFDSMKHQYHDFFHETVISH